jgi:hypothetical protein
MMVHLHWSDIEFVLMVVGVLVCLVGGGYALLTLDDGAE